MSDMISKFKCVLKPGILSRLAEAGYSTYRLRKERILSESTIQRIRSSEEVSLRTYVVIAQLLGDRDILEYERG